MVADKPIKITEATKKGLDNLKENKRETYDDVISRLVKPVDANSEPKEGAK